MKKYLIFILLTSLLFASCKDNTAKNDTNNETSEATPVKNISYAIIKSYPHDTGSFTQGLIVYKGKMYEGTGGYDTVAGEKRSKLMAINLPTGKVEKTIFIPRNYFGEGITILNDTIYQLTWKEHKVIVYTLPGFKTIKEYSINTEGWGITTNGKELIVSDGTSNLYYYSPAGFKLLRTQSITQAGELSFNLNELEYIDGFIYANQWLQPYIFKIDPSSGNIVGRIDLSEIWNRVKNIDVNADVPNGIAFDEISKKIYITGKKWPELYEIELGK